MLSAGTRIGAFVLRREIASGGMGTVFEAEQDSPRRTVALKLMKRAVASNTERQRFELEAKVLARLAHPNIAQIHAAGTWDQGVDVPFLAMEYVENGRSLVQYARENGLNLRGRLNLFRQALAAMTHAHQRGVIHRDLKPSNILVNGAGMVKIIDFGVARAADLSETGASLLTATGEILGTLRYMSPEQLLALPDEVDTRTDVYSLGVVLCELICGDTPFDPTGKSIFEFAHNVRMTPPKLPTQRDAKLPAELDWIVARSIETERERRYASVADLDADIGLFLNGETIHAAPVGTRYRLRKFVERNRTIVLATLVVFLSLLSGLLYALHARGQEALARKRAESAAETASAAQASEAKARKRAEDAARDATATLTFLQQMLTSLEPEKFGRDVRVKDVLDSARATIEKGFLGPPLVEATLAATLASSYLVLGDIEHAGPLLERAVELRKLNLPPHDPAIVEVTRGLGQLRMGQERYAEAADLFRAAYDDSIAVADFGHAVECIRARGTALARSQNGVEASKALREAGDLAAKQLDPFDPIRLAAETSLFDDLRTHGEIEAAETLGRGVLERASRDAANATLRFQVMEGLALVLADDRRAEKKTAESLALLSEAASGLEGLLGLAHPFTASTLENLAYGYDKAGDLQHSLETYEHYARATEASSGRTAAGVQRAKEICVVRLLALGRNADASALANEIVALTETIGSIDPNGARLRSARLHLALTLLATGEWHAAREICDDAGGDALDLLAKWIVESRSSLARPSEAAASALDEDDHDFLDSLVLRLEARGATAPAATLKGP